ncbi:MAG: hypothetical protein U1D30_17640 [Planctomycetota bacterium]
MWTSAWILIFTVGADYAAPAISPSLMDSQPAYALGRRKRQVFLPTGEPWSADDKKPSIQPRHLFLRHHDRNRDGLLGPEEVTERQLRAFARTDRNLDGFLDSQELLTGRTRLNQEARRIEQLRLGREGQIVARRSEDRNENRASASLEVANSQTQANENITPPPGIDRGPTNLQAMPTSTNANAIQDAPSVKAANPGLKLDPEIPENGKGDGLPTAAEILLNLDRNGDGMLDPSEAVDQLADNFARLDKDRDGRLTSTEIDRGLRLARLFGIKPKQDPRNYQKVH